MEKELDYLRKEIRDINTWLTVLKDDEIRLKTDMEVKFYTSRAKEMSSEKQILENIVNKLLKQDTGKATKSK